MTTFMCNKLARDKTLEDMHKDGIRTRHTKLTKKKLILALQKKLIEEAREVLEASNRKEIVEELADTLEVIDALQEAYEITREEIMSVKSHKRQKRGGFKQGIFLKSIEMENDNPWLKHFRAAPHKYPEFKATRS